MGFLEDRDFSDVPTIPEFYRNKTLFITGGSGKLQKETNRNLKLFQRGYQWLKHKTEMVNGLNWQLVVLS